MDTNQREGRTLRAFMGVAAALCVLGLASLVFLHAPDATLGVVESPAGTATAAPLPPAQPGLGFTDVPSAESVFRGKGYVAPEAPIAQF